MKQTTPLSIVLSLRIGSTTRRLNNMSDKNDWCNESNKRLEVVLQKRINKVQRSSRYNGAPPTCARSRDSKTLGGCPVHGRVERDEIPTRESPPKQSGTLPCPALPFPPLHSTPLPSPPLNSLPSACLLLSISMHTVCEVGELN